MDLVIINQKFYPIREGVRFKRAQRESMAVLSMNDFAAFCQELTGGIANHFIFFQGDEQVTVNAYFIANKDWQKAEPPFSLEEVAYTSKVLCSEIVELYTLDGRSASWSFSLKRII